MPVINTNADEWFVLGTILDDATFENDVTDVVLISTDTLEPLGFVTLNKGESITIIAGHYVSVKTKRASDVNYIYKNVTDPVWAVIDNLAVDEDEAIAVDLKDHVTGNNVIFAITSVVDGEAGAAEGLEIEDATLGVLTGAFADADTYTVTLSATNAAGTDSVVFDVVVSTP